MINDTCKFCNNTVEHDVSANMILICPECKKVIKITCDYGFGPILPCDIYVGSEIVATIKDGYILVSKVFNFEIQLKEESKDLAVYNEAVRAIQQYL